MAATPTADSVAPPDSGRYADRVNEANGADRPAATAPAATAPAARRLLKAGGAVDAHNSAGSVSGGRSATYGAGRWGLTASSVTRRAPAAHYAGGATYGRSVPYYYGRRAVGHNMFLMVLVSSHFHNHNGYATGAQCGSDAVSYDRFACKQAATVCSRGCNPPRALEAATPCMRGSGAFSYIRGR